MVIQTKQKSFRRRLGELKLQLLRTESLLTSQTLKMPTDSGGHQQRITSPFTLLSWELKKPASPCSLLYSGGDQQRINSHQLPTLLPPENPMESLHWRIKEQS